MPALLKAAAPVVTTVLVSIPQPEPCWVLLGTVIVILMHTVLWHERHMYRCIEQHTYDGHAAAHVHAANSQGLKVLWHTVTTENKSTNKRTAEMTFKGILDLQHDCIWGEEWDCAGIIDDEAVIHQPLKHSACSL